MKFDFSKLKKEQEEKLKALLAEFNIIPATPPATPAVPVKKFGEAKLKDGTVIKWEGEGALTVGASLLVVDSANPEGFLPIPNSPEEGYSLEDGTIFKTVDGKVTEVTPAAPVVPPATPDPAAQVAQMSAELKEVNEKFATANKEKETLTNEVKTIKSDFEKNKTELDGVKKSLEETTKKLTETLAMFAEVMKAPDEKPIEKPEFKPVSGIGSKVGK